MYSAKNLETRSEKRRKNQRSWKSSRKKI